MTQTLLESFVSQVIATSSYEELDRIYLSNRVMALVGEEGIEARTAATNLIDLKDELVDLAVKNGLCGELLEERDIIGAQLMDLITPAPSQINTGFWQTYATNPEQAIADFYQLSQANEYFELGCLKNRISDGLRA